jgi:hypothetical protein
MHFLPIVLEVASPCLVKLKIEEATERFKNRQRFLFDISMYHSVPNIRVGHCLGPKGSGDSSRGGDEGGPGPWARKEISS